MSLKENWKGEKSCSWQYPLFKTSSSGRRVNRLGSTLSIWPRLVPYFRSRAYRILCPWLHGAFWRYIIQVGPWGIHLVLFALQLGIFGRTLWLLPWHVPGWERVPMYHVPPYSPSIVLGIPLCRDSVWSPVLLLPHILLLLVFQWAAESVCFVPPWVASRVLHVTRLRLGGFSWLVASPIEQHCSRQFSWLSMGRSIFLSVCE